MVRVSINTYANDNIFFASSDACVRQTSGTSCNAGAPGIMSLTILTWVSTLLVSAVRTMYAFLRALSVMDSSIILFIARALVRVSILSNGQFVGVDTFSMADCFSPAGVTE